MCRLTRWLCHSNVCVLFLFWYNMWCNYVCNGHWLNYFLPPEQSVHTSAKSIFILCLWVFMSAESTGTYGSLGRQYKPLSSLSFGDVCSSLCLQWPLTQLFQQPGLAVWANIWSIFPWCQCIFMFALATGTTISCNYGKWYGQLFSLSFLDVYLSLCLQWLLTHLFPAAWADSMGHCLVYLSLTSMYLYVCSGYWHKYFLQPG